MMRTTETTTSETSRRKRLFATDADELLAGQILKILPKHDQTHSVEMVVYDLSMLMGVHAEAGKVRYILQRLAENNLVTRTDDFRIKAGRFKGKDKTTIWNKVG